MTFAADQEDKNQDQYVFSSEQKKKIKLLITIFDSAVKRTVSLPKLKASQTQEALPVKGHHKRTVAIWSSLKLRKKKLRNRCSNVFLLKRWRDYAKIWRPWLKNNICIQITTCLWPFQITPQASASVVPSTRQGSLFLFLFVRGQLWSITNGPVINCRDNLRISFQSRYITWNTAKLHVWVHHSPLDSQILEYWKYYNNRSLKFLTTLYAIFIYSLLLLEIQLKSSNRPGQHTTADLHYSPIDTRGTYVLPGTI